MQACGVELVDLRAELDRADLHLLDHGIVTDMNSEFAGFPDIACGVLEPHVSIVFDADGDDGRIVGQHVEEAERTGIGIAVTIDGGDQGDRSRDDRADQQLVFLPLGELGKVEMGVLLDLAHQTATRWVSSGVWRLRFS